jgi:phosphate transport system substrate-binding protein
MIDENLDVTYYRPFSPVTKIVILEGESTLKFIDNLPYLDGATALYPVYSAFANAVYPRPDDIDFYYLNRFDRSGARIRGKVACSTTPFAYKNLINDDVDIIFCFAPSDEQTIMANTRGVTFYLTDIGKDAFVFFVNVDNPISNLTSSQIRDIYSGRITNWKQLDGNDCEIIPYQREKNSGSQTILESIMAGDTIVDPVKENIVQGMRGMIEQVASYNNSEKSIGYSFLFYSAEMVRNNKIKLLSIDGVFPTKNTIKSGEYPFTKIFYAITTGSESDNANKFIEWILSEQGQYLIEQTGYIPITDPAIIIWPKRIKCSIIKVWKE